ncbi:hypothetical protein ACLECU_01520 [Lonsdalea quercina]
MLNAIMLALSDNLAVVECRRECSDPSTHAIAVFEEGFTASL